ncbi:LacI family DNA-binding transcriptional regulator [Nonomuraea terrae]|uniref:LacI family DNA-binding transcriptional regulator n=1 Tax=Nonomuraea terrae TaxID=2530383 RepID=UPI00378BB240
MTLEVVARYAGVSPATASRVLNGTTRVRAELKERVLAAADLLGHIPNAHAQALTHVLLDLGHCDFAVLAGPRALTTVSDRLGASATPWSGRASTSPPTRSSRGPSPGTAGMTRAPACSSGGSGRPVSCAVTDVMAIGAPAALRDHGLRVPEDVSLAGFDDIPIVRDLSPRSRPWRRPRRDGRGGHGPRAAEPPHRRSRVTRFGGEVVLRASTTPL